MKKLLGKTLSVLVCTLLIGLGIVNSYANATTIAEGNKKKTIADIAVEDGRFNTLVSALKAADLVDTLNEDGPFTVFAPTDDAFKKLGMSTVNDLLKPENKKVLEDILLYHVFPKELSSKKIVKYDGKELNMANGKEAKIEVKEGSVYIDGAKIIITDIIAKNGTIHVIDTVMQP